MDLSSGKWFPEMEMDDSWQDISSFENSVDSFTFKSFPSKDKTTNQSSTLKSAPQVSQIFFEKPITQVEKKPWKYCASDQKASSSSSSTIISFVNSDSPRANANNYYEKTKFYVKPEIEAMSLENVNSSSISQISLENPYGPLRFDEGVKKGANRTPAQAQDHVLAERKRRERLTQRFVALSAVIPGLKKLDKTTVLEDAVNYIKELQGRVEKLEGEVKRNNEEIVVGVKRPRLSGYDEASSSDESFNSSSDQSSPEIEVRASEGNVLVRVYCKQQTAIIKEILGEMERHHLTMVSSSIIPFGDNKLHMTIIAKMADHQSHMTANNLVDNLRKAIQTLI